MSVARLDCLAAPLLVISGNPLGLVEVESIFARVLIAFCCYGGGGGGDARPELTRQKVGQVGPCENMGCCDATYRGRCGSLLT